MKSTICTILVGIVFVLAVGLTIQNYQRGQRVVMLESMVHIATGRIEAQANHIPTIKELLSKLRRTGYYKGNDVWGKNATSAYRRYSFDQYALVYFNPNMYRKAKR